MNLAIPAAADQGSWSKLRGLDAERLGEAGELRDGHEPRQLTHAARHSQDAAEKPACLRSSQPRINGAPASRRCSD
jgi:hypothetical protein